MKRLFIILVCMGVLVSIPSGVLAKDYSGKKILFIDSYHAGYPWSDGITQGVKSALEGTGVELKIVRMDTKRNKSEEAKLAAALKAKGVIEAFKPDVVIAADDNASKYLIVPYYKDKALPFVFCGVNWDASIYGFPCSNVTGMVEVNAVTELVKRLREFSKGDKIGFLGEDTLTDRKEAENYRKIFNLPLTEYYATGFEDWKGGFVSLQGAVDILINFNYIGIADWNAGQAARFAAQKSEIPSGAFQEGPMTHTLLGYLKVPEEQGDWAAKTALKILDGTPPSAIPVARNKQGRLMLNLKIANRLGIEFPYDMIESAYKVIE